MMTTRVEDLTNEQLDVLVAEKVMEWRLHNNAVWMTSGGESTNRWLPGAHVEEAAFWQPSTNIAQAFEVDKPDEWRWWTVECTMVGRLIVSIWAAGQLGSRIALVEVHLDPDNKTAAYCRGRCICALKACGVMEI